MISKLLQHIFKHIDSFLMVCLFFTLMVGLFVLYSASGQNISRVYAQGINIVVAFGFMWVAANIAPNQLERIATAALYTGCCAANQRCIVRTHQPRRAALARYRAN